ncbi:MULTISPECIES: hypothetical protein [unclassified Bradyrhizobium]
MDRFERQQLIDRLQAEIVEGEIAIAERRQRRELHGAPETWQLPPEREMVRKHGPSSSLIFKTVEDALVETPPRLISDHIQHALNRTSDVIGEEVALIHRQINDTIRALTERVDALETQVADLQDQVNTLAGDLADVERDGGSKVVRMKPNAA